MLIALRFKVASTAIAVVGISHRERLTTKYSKTATEKIHRISYVYFPTKSPIVYSQPIVIP